MNLKKVETVLIEELEKAARKKLTIDAFEETSEPDSCTPKSDQLETPKFKHKINNQLQVNTNQNNPANNKQDGEVSPKENAELDYKKSFKSTHSLPPTNIVDNLINVNQMTNYFPYPYYYGDVNVQAQTPFPPNPTVTNPPKSHSRNKYSHAKGSSTLIKKTNNNDPPLKQKPKNDNSRIVMALRGIKRQQSNASLLSQKSNRSQSVTKNRQKKQIIQQRMRLKQMERHSNKNNSQPRQGSQVAHRKSRFFEAAYQRGNYASQRAIPNAKTFDQFATQMYNSRPSKNHQENRNDSKGDLSDLDKSGFSIKLNGVDVPGPSVEKKFASGRTKRTIGFGDIKRKRAKRTKNKDDALLASKVRFGRYRTKKNILERDTKDSKKK